MTHKNTCRQIPEERKRCTEKYLMITFEKDGYPPNSKKYQSNPTAKTKWNKKKPTNGSSHDI